MNLQPISDTTGTSADDAVSGDSVGSPIVGRAAGVPYVAMPPASEPTESTPVVIAWHLMDPPRTEAAFAAALPLDGLDAWRIYLGLPLMGSRLPAGGFEEFMRLGAEDAVMNLYGPVCRQAAEEFPVAYAEFRDRLGLGSAATIGVLGGSHGAAVALTVLAERPMAIEAAVLVSPLVQLRPIVKAAGEQYGVTYAWSEESETVADQIDFVARAGEVGREEPAVRLVVGAGDHAEAVLQPAASLRDALADRYARADRVDLVTIEGMEHALADGPGMEPAPQLPHAAAVDRHAVEWLQRHLRPQSSR